MKQQSIVKNEFLPRHGGAVAPLIVATALFAIVLGTVCYWGLSSPHEKNSITNQETADVGVLSRQVSQQPQVPDALLLDTPATKRLIKVASLDLEEKTNTPKIQQVSAETEATQPDLQQRVQVRLTAGEFGPALAIAQTESKGKKRTALIRLIVQAQIETGEFQGALAAIRRIPASEERDNLFKEKVQKQSLSGGGAQADYTQLMQLIRTQTSGPWRTTSTGDGLGGVDDADEEDEEGGTMSPYNTGVFVDPNGLLHLRSKAEKFQRLKRLGIHARQADLNQDMAKNSPLRLISLNRLEKEIARRQKAGEPVLQTMKHLAGLSQIKYVFIYPEEGDVVIGGPAEAWQYNSEGTPIGVDSGRPTLQLDDFVTVLRTFSKGGNGAFQCLIVPREENMKKVQEYSNRSQGTLGSSSSIRNFAKQIEKRLGEQDVVYNGIPRNSRVARVILDADYKMKLIGINRLEKGGIRSYFDLLPKEQQKNGPSNSALRWWLTMKYDAVLHSDDHNVFEIQGASVLCQSENEFITKEGKRIHTGKAEPTNRAFASGFTSRYAKLASEETCFADMQNIFDLSLVAALLNRERVEGRFRWNSGVFAKGKGYRPMTYASVQTVPSAVNFRIYNGRDIVVQAAGGVKGDLNTVLENPKIFKQAPRLGNMSTTAKAPQLPEGRWWWDASSK
ncbi:hypothetical protein MNBD_PLANCTO02-1591 [hydrothermal vent metagenome]|uniref:Uncharacterized protein n=1 Tax=hydrothermal vent metagenome TaxID=652676 RepID=A0A3B1D4D2_9ZZZZ